MANIKFSAFTQKVVDTDVDFLVGYTGADNVRISPSAIGQGVYLPLTGGTMTGNLKLNDNVELRLGNGNDLKAYHSGAQTYIENNTGDLNILNKANDRDINLQTDNGSGGVATYIKLDGSTTDTYFLNPGNVGIGTANPSYKFTAYGSSSDSEIVASFGSANDISEYTAIGLSGFIAGNDATKAGLALERTASFGVGKLHFLNNTTIDDSDMTLSDSRMVIDIDGNVGVGTTSPLDKLHVNGGNISIQNVDSSSPYTASGKLRFLGKYDRYLGGINTVNTGSYAEYDNGLDFYVQRNTFDAAGHFAMRINHLGNVGIGTTTPSGRLEVNGDVKIGDTTTGAQLIKNGNDFDIVGVDVSGNAFNSLHLKADSLTGLYIEKDTNNIGIGTTSPSSFNSRGRNLVVNSDGDTGITISANSTSSSTLLFADAFAGTGGTATYRGVVEYDHSNDSMAFSTAAAHRMRITNTGNVGIGTTSPTATLHVESANDALLRLKSTDNKAYIALSDNDTNGYISSENSKLSLGANIGSNANNLNIDLTNNRVGIGTSSPASKLEVDGGDVEVSDSLNGLILKSPDGTRYRVTVANGGTLTVSAV